MSIASTMHLRTDAKSVPREKDVAQLWVGRVTLTNFRSYTAATLDVGPAPVVLLGPNGAGKTNLLEAISLLVPGSGLRRAQYSDLSRRACDGDWSVAAEVRTSAGTLTIGTGQRPDINRDTGRETGADGARAGRIVRIDGEPSSPAALADHVEMVWLTPAMDGLFTGPAAERRRFLDRLIVCFDPGYGAISNRFERAMRQRNRLLEDGVRDDAQLAGLETQMAECGVAIAAARLQAVDALGAMIDERRRRDPGSPFPWAVLALDGALETALGTMPAVDVEDRYRATLARARERDRGAGRALDGPHRADFNVTHGPKGMPARLSSTGEQKALLMGLVLAHASLIAEHRRAAAPILLLDEVAAHFDEARRAALFTEILRLGAQAWMTGTEPDAFAALAGKAAFARVEDGRVVAMR